MGCSTVLVVKFINIMDNKIYTIRKVNFTGKWVEFWFEEEINIIPANPISEYEHLRVEQDKWIESCKGWKLHALAEESGLEDEVYNNGFVGLNIEFEYSSPNWNPIRVFKYKKKETIYYVKYELSKSQDILKDGHTMFSKDVVKDLKRKSQLEEENLKLHSDEDVKNFANFLMDEGIVTKSEDKNYSMNYLFDVWSGKNPDGLL